MKDASYKAIKENDIDLMSMGFFLSTRDTYVHVLQDLEHGKIHCVLRSKLIKPLLAFKDLEKSLPFNKTFKELEANQFTLVFSNCICDIVVSMDITTIIYNLEEDGDGTRDYLSAGETLLGKLYFSLSLISVALAGVWIYVVVKNRLTAYRIDVFMAALVCVKSLNLLCEAEDKSFIKGMGTTHGWDVLFYFFSFLKGIMLLP